MKIKRILGWIALSIPVVAIAALTIAYLSSDNACGDGSAGIPAGPVQAVTYCDYGTAEVLQLERIEKPVPADDQILVRVAAAAVNPLDWHYIRGIPIPHAAHVRDFVARRNCGSVSTTREPSRRWAQRSRASSRATRCSAEGPVHSRNTWLHARMVESP